MLYKKVGSLELPMIGLGTYGLSASAIRYILVSAVGYGTMYVDSAFRYDNEDLIGNCLKKNYVRRESIILGTKLSFKQQVTSNVQSAVEESLKNLKTEYIDLYFIHSPKSDTYCRDWEKLLKIKQSGKILELAVSNFNSEHIEQLYKVTGAYPALNQIEVHVGCFPQDTIQYCKDRNIAVQASCPLKRMSIDICNNDVLLDLSKKYMKSIAQLSLRWLLQHNLLSIPRTCSLSHMQENFDIWDFEIELDDMKLIDGLT